MSVGDGRRFSARANEILRRGEKACRVLPDPEQLGQREAADRRATLDGLRVELYAISSIVAEAAVRRALDQAPAYPPYGLVRSMHSELRLLAANPGPVEEGAVDSFRALGRAYLDTVVFHLDREFKMQRAGDEAWMIKRLEHLLALFRIDAGPASRERMRNGLSFLYGGLHFGVSICSQLAEVMARVLEQRPGLAPAEKAVIITRSVRPAYRLAALNLDHVIPAYQGLLETSGWMKAEHFVFHDSEDERWRMDLREDAIARRHEGEPDRPTTYATQGCPARRSPSGGDSPIALLWGRCAELAHDTGLLGPVKSRLREAPPPEGAGA
jgi:hypothetical protein